MFITDPKTKKTLWVSRADYEKEKRRKMAKKSSADKTKANARVPSVNSQSKIVE